MSEKTVFVFVENAVVEDVQGVDDFVVIDFDVLESGDCPICKAVLGTIKDNLCYNCGIDWGNIPDYEELVKIFKKVSW